MKKLRKLALIGLAGLGLPVFAEGSVTYTTPPGLTDAINTAKATAEGLAGDIVPAAVVILFAFAGLLGVYLLWRVVRRGAGGR